MYVRIADNIVVEIIPEFDPVFPGVPITDRYAPDFLAHCIQVPDEADVKQGWLYDPATGGFFEPPAPEPAPSP